MITITSKKQDSLLTLTVGGRLDTTTAPEFEQTAKEAIDGITELTLDFGELEYISSVGLRVLLTLQKTMNKQGNMVVLNANETIMEVFDMTGFSDILTLK